MLVPVLHGHGQCPTLYDYYGVPEAAPVWYSCSGTNFTLLVGSPQTIGAFTIDWGDGSPLYSGASLVPPQTVGHVYSTAVAVYTLTFTETATGCVTTGTVIMEESTSASIQIPIGGLTQVCAPQAVEFINSSTNTSENTVFTWDFGDGTPLQVFDHTNFGQTISHTYLPGTVSCETTVRLYAENHCNTLQGGASQATFNPIRVWDLDSANIAPSATLLCWPDNEVTYLNVTDRNCLNQGNIYQRFEYWNFGDYWGQGQDSIIDWTPWPPTFPHTIAYPGIGTYEVTMLDSNYCGIDTARVTITIVPPPNVSLSVDPDTICAGETAFFEQVTNGGANYFQWNFGAGGGWNSTGAGDQAQTYNTAGEYLISYAASIQGATAGCADTASVPLVVLPSPDASFTADQVAACDSLTVTFTNTSVGGLSRLWDFGDGTTSTLPQPPPHFYGSTGTYTVTLTVENAQGCSSSSNLDITVYDPPVVQIGAQNVCEGMLAQFLDETVTAPGNEVVQWDWDLGDGTLSNLQDPTHLYGTSGGFVVTLVATTPYCSGAGTQNVLVEPAPVASFLTTPTTGCSPLHVQFTNTSTGFASQTWDLGDGSTSTLPSPSHVYLNAGPGDRTDTVQLVVSTLFGCTDTATAMVTVSPPVVAAFTHNAQPGCAPLDVQFNNTSSGAVSYVWDFGDGTTSTQSSPAHQYINNTLFLQNHLVSLIATSASGCVDTTSQTISVYPAPNFQFAAQPDSGCSPLSVTFPSIVGAVNYQWDFGDGSAGTGASPTHTYLNNTDSVLDLTVTMIGANAFGCVDTVQDVVSVFPDPVADFALGQTTGCHPLSGQLTNLSIGATDYLWDYGDGASSTTGSTIHAHTWTNFQGPGPISYPVTLTATNIHGCAQVATASVEVYPEVQAAFTLDSSGCSPFDPDLANASTGASSYFWDLGDGSGSTLSAPSHNYVLQGVADSLFQVQLIATSAYGCSDTATAPVLVHPAPIAQFFPLPLVGCQPLDVDFDDQSIGAQQVNWSFGDGAMINVPPGDLSHTYSHGAAVTQTFIVEQIASSVHGCLDTTSRTVDVYPQVLAAFNVPSSACSPFQVEPVDQSIGATTYLWDMGDGTVLGGPAPSHAFINNSGSDLQRTITLIVTSAFGCSDTVQQSVTVLSAPTAGFQATPFTQQYPSSTISITNTSVQGNFSYAWDMGDGVTSTQQFPIDHTYNTWGQFTIQLVVSNSVCSDTATQVVEITPPLPTAGFIGSGQGCVPLTVSFTNTSLLGQSYQWNFGDGGSSTADDPVYTYTIPGTYTVSLTAIGPGGTVNTAVHVDSIVVHPSANAFFVLQPGEVVVPSQPVFTYNLSANADSYFWNMGDGTTTTEFAPVHYYTAPGTYDVTLIANNACNCPDTFTVNEAVTGEAAGDIQFPNAFTPNDLGPTDGSYDPQSFDNDVFFPLYSGVEDYHLQVFNRWGELVFESFDVTKGWDGYYRGRPAKQDVYAWKARVRFSDGNETTQAGDVTLIR
ncbi:MAG: PKD domain-containing protein [Flavobacteriales bacterium]|nr:PKD domain-containing protein [Flavobacteriales bacterium]